MPVRADWHCLELTRTKGWRARDREDDELVDFPHFIRWAEGRGLVDDSESGRLIAEARRRPGEAEEALASARTLRALLYQLFTRLADGVPPDDDRVEQLSEFLVRYVRGRRLGAGEEGVFWRWRFDPYRLDRVLGPIVWSAAELLTSPEAKRLRLCRADDCGWLFVDVSRNRSRRWCDMSDCGNREKARRFRTRTRRAAP